MSPDDRDQMRAEMLTAMAATIIVGLMVVWAVCRIRATMATAAADAPPAPLVPLAPAPTPPAPLAPAAAPPPVPAGIGTP